MYLPSEIVNFLYKTGFVIVKEKEYSNNPVSLPYPVWNEMKEQIRKSCERLNEKEVNVYIKEIEKIETEIDSHGLETLPLFMIFAKRSKMRDNSIPIKISSL